MYEIYDLWSLSNKSLDIDLNDGYWLIVYGLALMNAKMN
jgi:hypothetical protein